MKEKFEFQGKRRDQVEFSSKMVYYSLMGIAIWLVANAFSMFLDWLL